MQNLLNPEHFLSAEIWQAEREQIFFKHWQYAGHAAQLVQPNDWVLANIAGREVVVQNFAGELRAFSNVCSHRFSAIRSKPCGHGPLQCPYHHWTYNKDGVPRGIPLRDQFSELADPGAIDKLALERWTVDHCGGLVFVRLASEGPSLKDFLGATYPALQAASESLIEVVREFEYTIEANWKLIIQNTLELYHIVAVHPRSFGKGMNYKRLATQRLVDEIVAPPHIVYRGENIDTAAPAQRPSATLRTILPRLLTSVLRPARNWANDGVRRKLNPGLFSRGGLKHFGIFPCFNLAISDAGLVTEIVYTPESAGKTRMRVRTWTPSLQNLNLIEQMLMRWRQATWADTARIVGDEDTSASEAVQRGLHNRGTMPPSSGLLSEGEQLVHRFQIFYLEAMAAPAAPRSS
jgi:Phenylpropionate dioxygenase and related ring-hydroxylating dioxygenases, large terminal subunit